MIRIRYAGRSGNNLFTYAFSRIVAEKFEYSLGDDLPKDNVLRNTPNPKGKEYTEKPISITDLHGGKDIFPGSLEPRQYVMHGYFQNVVYYQDRRDQIKKFFVLNHGESHKGSLAIHVRLSDYFRFGSKGTVLDPSYYTQILDRESFDRLYIVTDDPKNGYLSVFEKYPREVITLPSKESFEFLMSCDRMVIANSSFSWWAAFLSNASKIYAPSVWLRYGSNGQNLFRVPFFEVSEAEFI